ncbi:MAG TPA: hypothetical protein VM662_06590 [Sphingomonas sp.]|nr:hypothetical protein [Sphingomonas sp.]
MVAAGRSAGRRVALGLSLAAAPCFAALAALSAVQGDGPALCSAAYGASPLTGMTAMYALMSLFHLAPWIARLTAH